jgi:general secretion pathway protein G
VEYSRHVRISSDIQGISTQLKLYESMNGFFPTTEQGLQALVVQPSTDPQPTRWYQLYKELPKDPWNNTYIYLNPGRKNPNGFDLYSAGPNRKDDNGTGDDDLGGN